MPIWSELGLERYREFCYSYQAAPENCGFNTICQFWITFTCYPLTFPMSFLSLSYAYLFWLKFLCFRYILKLSLVLWFIYILYKKIYACLQEYWILRCLLGMWWLPLEYLREKVVFTIHKNQGMIWGTKHVVFFNIRDNSMLSIFLDERPNMGGRVLAKS